ncbi:AMP-binding protein [Nitratireductor sp. CAU 1489]|uniref:AMP-binding protein n=1 Tax=Nitratireductor arenosus TaxID=2682096 RepID=A0A844QDQ1_9HYPH|nr:AMP-binding protein [Nitratireductor arenosus]MVA96228.1 AMP-binding protein [Nitratireductor arenosus]
MPNYMQTYRKWQADPEAFWAVAAREIDWVEPASRVFDPGQGIYGRWFVGATCNTCWNCVDRHVASGRGDQTAVIHDSPVTGMKTSFTFTQVQAHVGALAHVLRAKGVTRGDRVIIYMPMVAEAIFAMLACARLGAVHSTVFGGFAAPELATRIDDARPKAIISASCGIERSRVIDYKALLDEALDLAVSSPDFCLILQRDAQVCDLTPGRDADYADLVGTALAQGHMAECVPVAATDPLYILYTSGTTGQPKGVVRDNGGHMVALKWSMRYHYGVEPGDVFWAASDIGWVVGHSYICYAPLLHGCTTVVYEGKPVGTPDAGAFWRVIQEHKVAALFAAPTAIRAVKKEDPDGHLVRRYDFSNFRTLFLAGERADTAVIEWAGRHIGRPVVNHWWQTETGWPMTGNPVGLGILPDKAGSTGVPMPGYDIRVLDDAGVQVAPGILGNIVCKLPLPPSSLPTLWNADDRFTNSYLSQFPGYYATSDAGVMDEDGYVHIMARTDDVINVAGHRLSTGAMEEVIASHPDVAECAVVGVADELKTELPLGLYVVRDGARTDTDQIEKELVALVRERIGAVAALRSAVKVDRLPKTRSGKILRGIIRAMANGEEWKVPAVIEDPAALPEINDALGARGMIRSATVSTD